MIGYLDTSAVVPLLVMEPASGACRRFWDEADDVVLCRIAFVEAAAALAQAERMGRITAAEQDRARAGLDDLWVEAAVIELDEELVRTAAALAHEHGLLGYDAVHCAAAVALSDGDLVAAAGDRALLGAWAASGVATYDTTIAE